MVCVCGVGLYLTTIFLMINLAIIFSVNLTTNLTTSLTIFFYCSINISLNFPQINVKNFSLTFQYLILLYKYKLGLCTGGQYSSTKTYPFCFTVQHKI